MPDNDSRHLVDPDLLPGLDRLTRMELTAENLPAIRQTMAEGAPPLESLASDTIARSEIRAPGPAGAPEVPIVLTRPRSATGPLPLLLFIHGGGFVIGSAANTGPGDVRLASDVACMVASVDYRLAPETPAPGAVEDCHAALVHCVEQADALGIDPNRIAIAGFSAGGGLAASLAQMLRDRGPVIPRLQMLFSPMLDDRTAVRQSPAHLGEFVWPHAGNAFGFQAWTGGRAGGEDLPPYAAAARMMDLRGLAPAFLDVGAIDLLAPETLAYAGRLIEAAVPTELHVHPGAYHGFELLAGVPVAERAHRLRTEALTRAFAA